MGQIIYQKKIIMTEKYEKEIENELYGNETEGVCIECCERVDREKLTDNLCNECYIRKVKNDFW